MLGWQLQYLEKDKTRGAVPRVMQKEAGQVQGGLRYLGQLFKQLQVSYHSQREFLLNRYQPLCKALASCSNSSG